MKIDVIVAENNNTESKKNNNRMEGSLSNCFPKDVNAVTVSSQHRLRLCRLVPRPDFSGYGFKVHAERYRAGQFIGQLENGSPARDSGLAVGDRIVEVNGVNVETDSHQELAERIAAAKNELTLLVVDQEADEYFRQMELPLTSTQPFVEQCGLGTTSTHVIQNSRKLEFNSLFHYQLNLG